MKRLFSPLRYFPAVMLLFLLSCGALQEKHIPMKKMEQVMADISLAEVYCSQVKYDSTSIYKPGMRNLDSLAVFYREIFRHYKISSTQFKESMDYYARNPEQMDTIMNHVTRILADSGKKYGVEN